MEGFFVSKKGIAFKGSLYLSHPETVKAIKITKNFILYSYLVLGLLTEKDILYLLSLVITGVT